MKYMVDELQADVERLTFERDRAFADMASIRRMLELEQAAHTVCAEARGREAKQYEKVLNSYVEENQRLSNEIERLSGHAIEQIGGEK